MNKLKIKYDGKEYVVDKNVWRWFGFLDFVEVALSLRYDGCPDLCAVYKKTNISKTNSHGLKIHKSVFSHLSKDKMGYRCDAEFEIIGDIQ
jgi:hypothetical protein